MNNKIVDQFILLHKLQSLSMQITNHEESLFRKTRLTKTEHRILLSIVFLSESKQIPIKLTDLVPFQNSKLACVSQTVDRMEKNGLIKKVRELSDKRIVSITITSKGKKLLEEVSNPNTEFIKRVFSVLSDTELEQTHAAMDKLLSVVEHEASLSGDKVNKLPFSQLSHFFNKSFFQ